MEAGKIFGLTLAIFATIALLWNFKPNLPKFPGDIYFSRFGIRVYIPWLSSILLTVVLVLAIDFLIK